MNNEKVEWNWELDLKNKREYKESKKCIDKSDIKFIEDILQFAGDDILEYWNLDNKIPGEDKRILELEDKYSKISKENKNDKQK